MVSLLQRTTGQWRRTSGQVIFNLELLVFGGHGQVQGCDGVALRLAHRARAIVRRHCVLARDGDKRRRGRRRGARGGMQHRDGHGWSGVSRRERRAGGGDFVSLCARSRSGGLGQSATATGNCSGRARPARGRERSTGGAGSVGVGWINLGGASVTGSRDEGEG